MRMLLLHSDWLEAEPKTKAVQEAEELKGGKQRFEECLVVFFSVEERDENKEADVAERASSEIDGVAKEVKTSKIVLYPYVHLSSSPSSPDIAKNVLKKMEIKLKNMNYEVEHTPFGWYKAFNIKVKGHPLSELSREIIVDVSGSSKQEDLISGALKAEEKVISTWYILQPDGELILAEKFDFSKYPNLEKFYKYEIAKIRSVPSEPPHIKLMRSMELVDYEDGSDPGNLRYYPKGRLIKSLLEKWVTSKVNEYGAMEVETPIMYDFHHQALKSYLDRFPARQYIVESAKKKFFLRFSACFGQFLMKSNMSISYRNLPLRMYELTRYSFRLEKAGELVGLRRLRAFTMPDMHTLCSDMEGAKDEFVKQFRLGIECMNDLEFKPGEYEMAFRCTKDFWDGNSKWVAELSKTFGRPILVEMWNIRFAYFDPKFEFNFVDSMDKASALTTVQIDHENAQRYGIQYTAADNTRRFPIILHCSPSGAIERCIYALLEKAAMISNKNGVPTLPLWLSPTQVRLCPVSDIYIGDCERIADILEKENIRVDIDDRTESVQRKIRDAELDWVPYIIVFGEKEKSGNLSTRIRESGKIEQMKVEDIIQIIKQKCVGKPYLHISLPRNISARPIFVTRK